MYSQSFERALLRERQRERVTISDEREKESSFLCGWILNNKILLDDKNDKFWIKMIKMIKIKIKLN